MVFSSLVISFLISLSSMAEYRAFQLSITKSSNPTPRYVLSTLDDIQYPEYYPLQTDEQIKISDTWMCYGRTDDFLSICPSPRGPASTSSRPTGSSNPP